MGELIGAAIQFGIGEGRALKGEGNGGRGSLHLGLDMLVKAAVEATAISVAAAKLNRSRYARIVWLPSRAPGE